MKRMREYWDTQSLSTTGVKLTYFGTQTGGGSSVWNATGVKTLEDTNMMAAGKLVDPFSMIIRAFRFRLAPGVSVANAKLVMTGGSGTLKINGVVVHEFLPAHVGQGNSIDGISDVASTELVRNGTGESRNLYVLSPAIPLKRGVSFAVEINWGTTPGTSAAVITQFSILGVEYDSDDEFNAAVAGLNNKAA